MKKLISPKANRSLDTALQKDVEDFLLQKRSGHIGHLQYGAPLWQGDSVQGSELWSEFRSTPDYYVVREEDSLLTEMVIPSLATMGLDCRSLIDLGPGDHDALQKRAMPLMRSQAIKNYYAVDLSSEFAASAANTVSNGLDIKSKAVVSNFLEDQILPDADHSLLFMAGSTISNIPLDMRTKDCTLYLSSLFSRLKGNNLNKRYLLISFDANQDEDSLKRSYGHPINARMAESIAWRIQRDTDFDLNPHNFEYISEWQSAENRYAHMLRLKSSCVISNDNNQIFLRAGQKLHIGNSFKFPVELIRDTAQNADWNVKHVWTQTGRLHYILLEWSKTPL